MHAVQDVLLWTRCAFSTHGEFNRRLIHSIGWRDGEDVQQLSQYQVILRGVSYLSRELENDEVVIISFSSFAAAVCDRPCNGWSLLTINCTLGIFLLLVDYSISMFRHLVVVFFSFVFAVRSTCAQFVIMFLTVIRARSVHRYSPYCLFFYWTDGGVSI